MSSVVCVEQQTIGIHAFELEPNGSVETSLPSWILRERLDGSVVEESVVSRHGREEDEEGDEREGEREE